MRVIRAIGIRRDWESRGDCGRGGRGGTTEDNSRDTADGNDRTASSENRHRVTVPVRMITGS